MSHIFCEPHAELQTITKPAVWGDLAVRIEDTTSLGDYGDYLSSGYGRRKLFPVQLLLRLRSWRFLKVCVHIEQKVLRLKNEL